MGILPVAFYRGMGILPVSGYNWLYRFWLFRDLGGRG
jgi:hypothetical protein